MNTGYFLHKTVTVMHRRYKIKSLPVILIFFSYKCSILFNHRYEILPFGIWAKSENIKFHLVKCIRESE